MAFAWNPIQFTDLTSFKSYLGTLKPPAWLKGLTIHHSAVPDQNTWQGMTHMKNIGAYYRDTLGWSAGPHLFLAAETQYDGIFQGTPLTTQGIHAGPCNYSRLGIEVVGNFNLKPWGPEVSALVYGVAILLMDWAKIPIKEVWVHRECMPGHTD